MNLGFRMAELWWPGDARDALSRGLVQLQQDGKTALSAEDGSGRIVLHQHRRRAAVCYPLLIRDAGQHFEYIWQTQVTLIGDFCLGLGWRI